METIALQNGMRMPSVGLGTWSLEGRVRAPLLWALDAGYRHIDTAKVYGTEEEIGSTLSECGVPREELFVTTKLWNADQGYERALDAFDASLARLQLTHVDLYLVHWPNEGSGIARQETWKAMEEIAAGGRAKAIGVSNYEVRHLEEMERYAALPPAVNQIEMHPFRFQKDIIEYCRAHEIALVFYSPVVRAKRLDHPVLARIAATHSRTVAQILLRWGIEHGGAVIPQSTNKAHIEENIDIFDFALSGDEMAQMNALDEGYSVQ